MRCAAMSRLAGAQSGQTVTPSPQAGTVTCRTCSAGAGEVGVVGGWAQDVDLGAVAAVGVPAATVVSLDAEAVVGLGVVAFAQQRGVGQAGLAAEQPMHHVMDLAPGGGGVAPGSGCAARTAP